MCPINISLSQMYEAKNLDKRPEVKKAYEVSRNNQKVAEEKKAETESEEMW